jgi:hypothetical protein
LPHQEIIPRLKKHENIIKTARIRSVDQDISSNQAVLAQDLVMIKPGFLNTGGNSFIE